MTVTSIGNVDPSSRMPTRSTPPESVESTRKSDGIRRSNRLADQLFGGPAEHHLDRTICKDEHATRVHRNDALRGGLEQGSQRAIVFLVPTRLESLLSPAALGDVQFESREPRDVTSRVAFGSSQTLHPEHGSIGTYETVCVIPRISPLHQFVECAKHPRAVVDVDTREPRVEQRGFLRSEPESCAEDVIPIGVIGSGIPRPGAACGRFECKPQPRFLFAECRFGAGALDGIPGPFGDLANELDVARRPHAWSVVRGAKCGNHLSVFETRDADQRRDLPRPERRSVVVAEPLIRLHVPDHDGLAAPESLA